MDYIWIIALAIIIITFAVVLVIRSRRTNTNSAIFDAGNPSSIIASVRESEIIIPIEQLTSTTTVDEKSLFEIKDNMVIARISQTIPTAAQTAANTVAKSIAKETLNNPNMFLVKIPSGTTLVNPTKKGVQYATYRGAKKGLAEVIKPDLTKMTKATAFANGVANVMNVGSLVVGQYYMSEINSKIEAMSKNVSKISDFQDREFKSRILAVIARVGEISNFSSEILENDDVRNRKLQTLDDLKGEGVQLLQQVNLEIDDMIKKNQKPDYKEYQESVDSFSVLIGYQQVLLSVLEEISKLTYLIEKGERTSEFCYSMFNIHLEQSNKIRTALEKWHQQQVESLGIDIDKNRKSRTGLEGFFAALPGFIDDKWNYKELAKDLGQKINAQKTTNQLVLSKPEDVYDKDVQIIIKNGKYYYLAE